MRKWFLLILLLLVIAAACLYFIIPGKITIEEKEGVLVNAKAFSRTILDEEKWKEWWPGDVLTRDSQHFGRYAYKGNVYAVIEKKMSSMVLSIRNDADSFTAELFFVPVKPDSIRLTWQGQFFSPQQPAGRIQNFFEAKSIKEDMATILGRIKSFYSNDSNVYGLKIIRGRVTDSTLISTSLTTKSLPSVENIYGLVDQLQAFAQKNGAEQTGLPMLNISTADSISYLTKVALPVNKKLKDEGQIVYRWMLGGGNILVAEVKGGPHTIKKGFDIIEKYTEDHNRVSPAIPFQSMVTDRRREPDTSKWVTKIYWPVM
jgi:hypothetical protein